MPSRRRNRPARNTAPETGHASSGTAPRHHDPRSGSDADPASQELAPAQRYSAAMERSARERSELGSFAKSLGFPLDPFQIEACEALEEGQGVLVAAPTGAGKTVVGEFAVHLALEHGTKAFYTTPIKALSNQKYSEFVARYGKDRVGLLTGDTSINSEAEIVVMTTEVLRNMLYAGSSTLTGLEYVVMDEVHYLADKERGAVWEEVILNLPRSAKVVSLSATVSNAEEFGGWLAEVRGSTAVVVSEHRPVPLWQHVMAGGELMDLFAEDVSFDQAADADAEVTVNPALEQIARRGSGRESEAMDSRGRQHRGRLDEGGHRGGRSARGRGRGGRGGHGAPDRGGARSQHGGKGGPRSRNSRATSGPGSGRLTGAGRGKFSGPSLPDLVVTLDDAGLLPAIVFIFSRKGCDEAVRQCVRAGLWLTNKEEQAEIERVLDDAARRVPAEDLDIIGYWPWREGVIRGIASHHAGLVPVFKEAVEDLFARGIVKVVFATETLALGVNMPARSVVLEKLDKFNGETHVPVTPGEYTQLTGRAGRRGIDVEGHAVVVWHEGMDPHAVAGLASRRTYPLNSSFRPTYNMSLNLLSRLGQPAARDVLERSFAQYQADASVVGLARQLAGRQESLDGYAEAMACDRGDFQEYDRLRQELGDLEKKASRHRSQARRSAAVMALESLSRGEAIHVGGRRKIGNAVVVQPAQSLKDPRPEVVTEDGRLRRLDPSDLDGPPEILAHVKIPKHFSGKSTAERKELASALRNALHEAARGGEAPQRRAPGFSYPDAGREEARIDRLRKEIAQHPCHGCSEREQHARWADRYRKLKKEADRLQAEITGRTHSIARTFDRVLAVLSAVGYVKGRGAEARVSDAGHIMLRLYGERDLLTALVLGTGVMEGLSAPAMASAVSMLVYMPKREDGSAPRVWPPGVKAVWDEALVQWGRLEDLEREHKVPLTPAPDFTLVEPIYRWALGEDLTVCLEDTPIEAGDFVRWAKQIIDFLGQIATNPQVSSDVADTAAQAADLVRRGVVAASSVVGDGLVAEDVPDEEILEEDVDEDAHEETDTGR